MAIADEEFSELAAALMPQLYRRAYLLTASHQHAEDLTQTALAKTYDAWWRVQRAVDPAAYVHGILLKSFLSERRRRSSGELPVADPKSEDAHDHDLADRIVLVDALAQLAALDRAVVVLRFWEDRSVEQTAALLNLSSAAVRNRSMRALKRLRVVLEPATKGA
ncbi:MAG TPA: SigE family RNA polymerase sigma factor [Nocardioidaceae bacterium]|nr:SigE family RNA polymerase sigma factor [Nocardioidaceae bacterium]